MTNAVLWFHFRRLGSQQIAGQFAQRRPGRSAQVGARSAALPVAQAQTQPKAAHALHHPAADGPGEEVPREAVPVHRRTSRILRVAVAHRNSGKFARPKTFQWNQNSIRSSWLLVKKWTTSRPKASSLDMQMRLNLNFFISGWNRWKFGSRTDGPRLNDCKRPNWRNCGWVRDRWAWARLSVCSPECRDFIRAAERSAAPRRPAPVPAAAARRPAPDHRRHLSTLPGLR